MKIFFTAIILHFSNLIGISYTDILGHISCKTAIYERHYFSEHTDVTICKFKKGTLLFTRSQNKDAKCVAYVNGKQANCPEPEEVY